MIFGMMFDDFKLSMIYQKRMKSMSWCKWYGFFWWFTKNLRQTWCETCGSQLEDNFFKFYFLFLAGEIGEMWRCRNIMLNINEHQLLMFNIFHFGLEHEFYFSIQLGISSSQLTNSIIFQRGRYITNQYYIHDIPMIFLLYSWYSYDIPMVFLLYSWYSYDIPMIFLLYSWYSWYSYDIPVIFMIFLWYSYDIPMIFLWYSCYIHDIPMIFLWYSCYIHDIPMIFLWYSYDIPVIFMIFLWYSYIFMLYSWYSYDIPIYSCYIHDIPMIFRAWTRKNRKIRKPLLRRWSTQRIRDAWPCARNIRACQARA